MKSQPKFSRKTIYGLVTAGLLSASMFTTALVALPPVPMAHADVAGLDATRSLNPLVEKVMPAVVSVEVKLNDKAAVADNSDDGDNNDNGGSGGMPPEMKHFFDQFPGFKFQSPQPQQRGGGRALGSGFVMSADGYVVTNNHVVEDATTVKVTFENGDSYDAKVIGTDAKTDLALLKIKAEGKTFPAVSFAGTEAKVGDTVMAVGNPFGLGGTVTKGIVSAHHRDIGNGPYDDFLQIDAAINKGNSGGPTFNLDGEVIGINIAIYSPSGGSVGIGFAIPAATASNVIEQLKSGGKITRGWLGVQIQPVSADIAESMGLSDSKGALVNDLTADSPAKKAGVKPGDAILKVDGQDVASDRDLAKLIGNIPPGKDVKLSIIRDGKPETVTVTLGIQPGKASLASNDQNNDSNAETDTGSNSLSAFGLEVAPAPGGKGVKIIKVDPKSDAADSGVREGDVILKIAGEDVSDASSVKDALKKTSAKKVLMLVKSAQGQNFIALGRDAG
ncbi:Do family serine endopeptidase [Aestuariivirga litoralis]|uniref:Do family serine endopeptidase n=1 Tax=Aestuariivirga litoralis TaxID=2650924 RepID=UPI0018C8528A|nr:Do family serine endopeptidase [Aestuariivirga litoralis]MBG1232210.1 Do family serine endopeptidase [Aestuariivirga litoralis]